MIYDTTQEQHIRTQTHTQASTLYELSLEPLRQNKEKDEKIFILFLHIDIVF